MSKDYVSTWNTKGEEVLVGKRIVQELKEQLQEDMLCLLEGQEPELVDAVCQTIINRVNQLNHDARN